MTKNIVTKVRSTKINNRKNAVVLWPAIILDYPESVMYHKYDHYKADIISERRDMDEIHTAIQAPFVEGVNNEYKKEYPSGALWVPEEKVWVIANLWFKDLKQWADTYGKSYFNADQGLMRILESNYQDRRWVIMDRPKPVITCRYNVRDLLQINGYPTTYAATSRTDVKGAYAGVKHIHKSDPPVTPSTLKQAPELVEADTAMRELLDQFDITLREKHTDLGQIML